MPHSYYGLKGLGALLVNGAAWAVRRIREAAYASVSGRYYEYKGNPIDIHEEALGTRWLSIRDVRRTAPGVPRDAVLLRLYPQRFREHGQPAELRIEASALEELLQKAQDQESIRFLRWLQRTVIFPARTKATRGRGAA